MKSYSKPSMAVVRLQSDVIRTSGPVIEPNPCQPGAPGYDPSTGSCNPGAMD